MVTTVQGVRLLICDCDQGTHSPFRRADGSRDGVREIGETAAPEARRAARAAGWTRTGRLDLCPECTAKRRAGAFG